MKTSLLSLIFLMFFVSGHAQDSFTQLTGPNKNLVLKPITVHPDVSNPVFGNVPGAKVYDFVTIGTTWNDAQTYNYGNLMQHVWAYGDGTVGAVWLSEGLNQDPDRGAGYNYFDGSEWGEPNLHVGPPNRMGSPCYAPWGENGEIIAQYRYIANEGPIYLYKRVEKGEGDWIEVEVLPPSGCSLVWQTMTTSGDNNEYIHLLAETYDTEYNGQANALLYYRSSDGGDSWDIFEHTIEGLGPDYYPTINHLAYNWSNPVGSTIAFTYGFDQWDGKVFKSNDHGTTWESMTVFSTGFDPFDPPTESANFAGGIGGSAIVLDSEGKAHVSFARMVHVFVDGSANFYPYTDGVVYWNEDMPQLDTATISATTLEYLEESGNLVGWILGDETYEIPADQPTYANSLCAFPVMSIDASDNMFVAWTGVAPNYSNGLVDYRHIVLNASFDGGTTWAGPEDLNTDLVFLFSECVFPSLAPWMYEHVQLTYQEDNEPGVFAWPSQQTIQTENNIHHMMIEKGTFVAVGENTLEAGDMVSQCYPNPATDHTVVQITLEQATGVGIQVVNVMGQVVRDLPLAVMPQGKNRVTLEVADLAPGIYYCTVEAGSQKTTRKFIVNR